MLIATGTRSKLGSAYRTDLDLVLLVNQVDISMMDIRVPIGKAKFAFGTVFVIRVCPLVSLEKVASREVGITAVDGAGEGGRLMDFCVRFELQIRHDDCHNESFQIDDRVSFLPVEANDNEIPLKAVVKRILVRDLEVMVD